MSQSVLTGAQVQSDVCQWTFFLVGGEGGGGTIADRESQAERTLEWRRGVSLTEAPLAAAVELRALQVAVETRMARGILVRVLLVRPLLVARVLVMLGPLEDIVSRTSSKEKAATLMLLLPSSGRLHFKSSRLGDFAPSKPRRHPHESLDHVSAYRRWKVCRWVSTSTQSAHSPGSRLANRQARLVHLNLIELVLVRARDISELGSI